MLTFAQIAKDTGMHIDTVRGWASKKIPARRRLRVIRLGHRTVRIRESDYATFLEIKEQSAV